MVTAEESGGNFRWEAHNCYNVYQFRHQLARRTAVRRWARLAGALAASALMIVGPATPAGAAELTTDYPAVTVAPGQTVTLDLEVTSSRRERVGLQVVEAPERWTTRLRGGGFEVQAVYADPTSPPTVQLSVGVPDDAGPGLGRVVVRATAPSGSSDLVVDLTVGDAGSGAGELTADFPEVRGAASDTFRFDLSLRNDATRAVTYGLEANGPQGWQVTARPSAQEQAATLTVEPGSTATIQVQADPPDDVAAGRYPIAVRATGAGAPLETELEVEVVGDVAFTLTTVGERVDTSGSAGRVTSIALQVVNEGSAPLEQLTLTGSPPTGWQVEFEPDTVESIAPGETARVTANIRPPGDAVAGDYVVSLTSSAGGSSESLDIRFAVKTSFGWGVIGVFVILLAIGAIVFVFRRFGRR